MPKKTQNCGRPSAFRSEVGEEYVQIWISKMYFKIPDWELAEKYDCSHSKIRRALEFVNENFVKIPNEILLKGAIFSIESREKYLTELLEKERSQDTPSVRSIVEINRELREDGKIKLQLQSLYTEKYDVVSSDGSIKAILQALAEKK